MHLIQSYIQTFAPRIVALQGVRADGSVVQAVADSLSEAARIGCAKGAMAESFIEIQYGQADDETRDAWIELGEHNARMLEREALEHYA